jgi:hypothetical protein
MRILEHIYLGSDNKSKWIIASDNVPIDFVANGTTKVEIYLGDILVTSDTSEVSFADGGLITLDLGQNVEIVVNEKYPVILKAYDGLNLNGQVLMHPSMDGSNANVQVLP